MIRKGDPWERPASGPADLAVAGDDAALALAVSQHPGVLVSYAPDGGDLARAVGVGGPTRGIEVALDALASSEGFAVNALVVGTPPDRQRRSTRSRDLTVRVDGRSWGSAPMLGLVVANGQFVRGHDLAPRGHPGDGRLEVQAYRVPARDRRTMRRRLASGTHLPHPGIEATTGRRVEIHATRPVPLEIDGRRVGSVRTLEVEIVRSAFRLLL